MTRASFVKTFSSRESGSSSTESIFTSFIKFPLMVYRLISLDFDPLIEKSTKAEKLMYFAKVSHVVCYLVCHWLAVGSLITLTVWSFDDFVKFSQTFMNACGSFFLGSKALTAFFGRRQTQELFEAIQEVVDLRDEQRWKSDIEKHLNKSNKMMKMFALPFVFMMMSIAFPIIPFLINGSMILTVDYWFPFDPYQQGNYCFVYIWVLWIEWHDVLHFLASEILFYALISVISMEFEFLRIDFTDVLKAHESGRSSKIEGLIIHHNKLLKLVDKLQQIYSINILSSFIASSIIIGFAAFQLSTTADNFTTFSFYVPYMAMFLGQILLICVSGQKLIDSSELIASGVYNCDWEACEDLAIKKQLILIIKRAQKSKILSAMNFLSVSHETFTTVSFQWQISDIM